MWPPSRSRFSSVVAASLVAVLGSGLAPSLSAAPPPSSGDRSSGPWTGESSPGGGSAPGFHTELDATFPAADSLHRGDVREVRLRFTTAVQLGLSRIRVRGADGGLLEATGPDTVPGTGRAEIRLRFPEPLPTGSYTVEWRTAGPDSHPIEGSYGFRIRRPEPAQARDSAGARTGEQEVESGEPAGVELTPAGASAVERAPGVAGTVVRWVFFLSIVGMVGSTVFRLAVLPVLGRERGWEEAARSGRDRLVRLAVVAAGLGVVSLPARFVNQVAGLFDGVGEVRVSAVWAVLSSTWGIGWLVELAAVAVFVAGLVFLRRHPRGGWLAMLVGAAALTVVPGLSGHARAVDPSLRSLALVVDAVHVGAAAVWLGGLGALVLAGIGAARLARGDAAEWALPRLVGAFSRVALTAVTALFATGLVNAWLHLGSPAALWESGYGRTLAVKLGLVVVVAALGLYNWRVVRPALQKTPRAGLLRAPATVELLVGLAILGVTAVLVASPLPGG